MKKKKPHSFPCKSWIFQLTAISAMALLSGATKADITIAQAQAMAENSNAQTVTFLFGVLGACASAYPETHADIVKAIQSMVPAGVEDEKANNLISAFGQCMSKEGGPTKSQCSDLATQLPRGSFDPNDPQFFPMFMASLEKLEPCRNRK
ncbi:MULTISPECIES: hypothetical protein [unclassified Variovorax]|uniref:hypothetical protein n=1 Tax=unclassified Variovorax TaxID=663243 RepID=UPI003F475F17